MAYPKVIPYVGEADVERKSRGRQSAFLNTCFDFFQFESL